MTEARIKRLVSNHTINLTQRTKTLTTSQPNFTHDPLKMICFLVLPQKGLKGRKGNGPEILPLLRALHSPARWTELREAREVERVDS